MSEPQMTDAPGSSGGVVRSAIPSNTEGLNFMAIATKQHLRKQTTPKAPAARTSVAKPQPTATRNVAKTPPAKTQAVRRQEAISSAHRTRPIVLPEKSHQAARSVFENFNPSRFA